MKKTGIAAFVIAMFVAANVFAAGTDTQAQSETIPGIQSQESSSEIQDQSMSMRSEKKASDILGKSIVNTQGDELGQVEDLIVSHDGEISHLIISRGGVLGMGEDLVPIPWSSAQANFEDENLVVNLEKDKFDEAPSFSADNWDEFFSPGYQENVRAFYGEEGAAETMPGMEPSPGTEPLPGTDTAPGTETSPGLETQPETAPTTP